MLNAIFAMMPAMFKQLAPETSSASAEKYAFTDAAEWIREHWLLVAGCLAGWIALCIIVPLILRAFRRSADRRKAKRIAQRSLVCPKCGVSIEAGKKYCPECGANMSEMPPAPPVRPEPTPLPQSEPISAPVTEEVTVPAPPPEETPAQESVPAEQICCPNCKEQIESSLNFCNHCGQKIPRCPTCGMFLPKKAAFCLHDGTPLPEELFTCISDLPDPLAE